jgi:hypothetical protein
VLPESTAFGSQSIDLLAEGNRVYGLSASVVVQAERGDATLYINSAPPRLTGPERTGKLVMDTAFRLLWVVSLGGTSIGAYDADRLSGMGTWTAPYPINAAVAMDDRLWFTTDHGLYLLSAAPQPPRRARGPAGRYESLSADVTKHRVLVSDGRTPSTVRAWTNRGVLDTVRLPIGDAALQVAYGHIWATGRVRNRPVLVQLYPDSMQPFDYSAAPDDLGNSPTILAAFDDVLLVRVEPPASLYCIDVHLGTLKQRWAALEGPATLNAYGLLVATDRGIRQLDARACVGG